VKFEDGILTVQVDVQGRAATAEKISEVVLQATKKNKESVTASEYVTVYNQDMKDLRLTDKKKFEADPQEIYHFRRAAKGINVADAEAGAAVKTLPAWSTTDGSDKEIELEYNGEIDLNNYVQVDELSTPERKANLEALGMEIKYEVVKNYKLGTNLTDQADFVNLNGSVLSAKVFDDAQKFAAVGRTPIIRATLMHGTQIVETAYIKVKIVKQAVEPKTIDMAVENLQFVCGQPDTITTTVKEMNVQVYNACHMDRDLFHNTYKVFDAQNGVAGQIGTVKELTETIDGETTHLIQWIVPNDSLWNHGGEAMTRTVYYRAADGDEQNVVKIVLKSAKVDGVQKVYNVESAKFINEYWDAAKTHANFNVAVPNAGSTNADSCTFVNDLNSPFVTNAGKIALDKAVTSYVFSFNKVEMEKIKSIGAYKVVFRVSDNGLNLYAKVDGGAEETIATIKNGNADVPFNTVTYSETESAKKLLNTNQMYALYSAKGVICNDNNRKVEIKFNGKDYFRANFVRPVNIAGVASDNLIDAVDMGEKGSFIALEKLIAPTDWRNRSFNAYKNYWKYYGVASITVDIEKVTCDLNGTKAPVPATITLAQAAAGTMGTGTSAQASDYGFLTYKNNGTGVKAFNLYVPVTVTYKWGTIVTDAVKVPVASTIGQ
jgi:hypothetical protein